MLFPVSLTTSVTTQLTVWLAVFPNIRWLELLSGFLGDNNDPFVLYHTGKATTVTGVPSLYKGEQSTFVPGSLGSVKTISVFRREVYGMHVLVGVLSRTITMTVEESTRSLIGISYVSLPL